MAAMGVIWLAIIFLIFYAAVYWYTIRWEEDKLAGRFPDDWEAYKRSVPRFLPIFRVPVYRSGEFSWSQVIKHKEMQNASVAVAVYFILWAKALFLGNV